MLHEPDAFFKNEETTKKYILFLQDVLKNRNKSSNHLIEQIKIQKELLLLDINVTTILKMDIYEAVNYIMNMINAKKIKADSESNIVDSKIHELIVTESVANVSQSDKDIIDTINNNKIADSITDTISDVEALDLDARREDILKSVQKPIQEVLNVDASKFDEERSIIRESLFNKKVTIHIIKTGKNYQYKWNVSMSDVVIKIPTTWEIDVDQSLLLELYTKVFNTLGRENKTELLQTLTQSLDVANTSGSIGSVSPLLDNSIITDDDGDNDSLDEDTEDTEDSVSDRKKRNKRVNIKTIKNFTEVEIIQLFKERQNVDAAIDSYTSVRSLIKRALSVTYSEATEIIINALINVSDEDIESFGISSTSHLYRNILKKRTNNA